MGTKKTGKGRRKIGRLGDQKFGGLQNHQHEARRGAKKQPDDDLDDENHKERQKSARHGGQASVHQRRDDE